MQERNSLCSFCGAAISYGFLFSARCRKELRAPGSSSTLTRTESGAYVETLAPRGPQKDKTLPEISN